MRKKLQTAGIVVGIVVLSVGATLLVQSWLGSTGTSPSEASKSELQTLKFLESEQAAEPATRPESDDKEMGGVVQAQASPEELAAQSARVDEAVRSEAGNWVQFVRENGLGVEGRVLVGAPGLWPYETLGSSPDGLVKLPSLDVTTLSRNSVHSYELLARSDDVQQPMAFWGEYNSPPPQAFENGLVEQAQITMVPAADVSFRIVDDEDKPVMGTFVRLSRDSVGLLHLTFTTGPDGRAVFSRLPAGQYSVTLNAEGFGRTVFDFDHTLDAEEHVVTLGESGSFRRPQSWRQDPSAAVARKAPTGATGASGAGNGTGGGANAQAEESESNVPGENEQDSRPLRVFVVDDDGAPVVGAYVEFWVGGVRAVSGTSKGHQPLELPSSTKEGRLFAIYPGMGEGDLVVVGGGDGDEQVDHVVTLNLPLFRSGAVTGRFHDPAQIEDVLGVELVDMDREWMFDLVDPDAIAGRGGIMRGDSLLSLRRTSTGFEAVVNRRGQIRRIVM